MTKFKKKSFNIGIFWLISFIADTYRSRSKRETNNLAYDADYAQKEILREFGQRACILEEPCRLHASRPGRVSQTHPNWSEVFR